MTPSFRSGIAIAGLSALVAAGCSGADTVDSGLAAEVSDRPTIVATTNILGDVITNLVGDQFDVVTIMPVGADPHVFQASAQQVASMGDADVLIANGAGFEEGLLDVIESSEADGVPVLEAISVVAGLEFGEGEEHGHEDEEHEGEEHEGEEHEGEEHEGEEHEGEEGHAHDGLDPHFFTDPARMATVATAVSDFLIETVDGVDAAALTASSEAYVDELVALDREVSETLGAIDDVDRVLITNHEVFGYFADRYDFEVVGTVIPSGTTTDGVSAQDLEELAEVIEHEGVQAIFAETSSSDELIQTLSSEVGDVAVVDLYSESLGDVDSAGATYIDMVRTNAERIAGALG